MWCGFNIDRWSQLWKFYCTTKEYCYFQDQYFDNFITEHWQCETELSKHVLKSKRGLKLYNSKLFFSALKATRYYCTSAHPWVWVLWHVTGTCHVTRVMWQLATRGCVTVRDRMTLSVMCDITSLMTIITSHNRKAGAWDGELWSEK